MGSIVREGAIFARTVNSSVAANNAITLAIGAAPPAGCVTVVDWITFSYLGTTQTSCNVNVQQAGGGTVYWLAHACGVAAGLGTFHWDFPGGLMPGAAAEAIEFSSAALANCTERVAIGYHVERLS